MPRNLRQYGLGDATQYVKGPARVKALLVGDGQDVTIKRISDELPAFDGAEHCPNCGCKVLAEVEVGIEGHPLLRGGKGVGKYLSCPACPWASPMVIVASGAAVTDKKEDTGED